MHGNCHFYLRVSTTPQHKNPQPATSMTVLRAPHQTNRSKPCCQQVKAMLQSWSTSQSHVANQSKPCCKTGQRVKATLQNIRAPRAKTTQSNILSTHTHTHVDLLVFCRRSNTAILMMSCHHLHCFFFSWTLNLCVFLVAKNSSYQSWRRW